jgi:hypothetical protein
METIITPKSIVKGIEDLNLKSESKKVSLGCNIRLRAGLVAIPNQVEEEFNYYVESVLAPSGGPLKGVTGTLERVLMPSIVDVSTSDNSFNTHIKEYWANFSSLLPPDSTNKRDTAQGIEIKIIVTLHGASAISKFEAAERLEEKFKVVHNLLEYQADNEGTKTVTLQADYYADFVKLAFIMKHPRVANRVEDKDKSPKIVGYIYEKIVAMAAQESEMDVFTTFANNMKDITDEKKVNAILLAVGEQVLDTDNLVDKKIIIYNLCKVSHVLRVKVNTLIGDTDWAYKYYVQQGLNLYILKQPTNSKLIQYGDAIIGNDLETAAKYIKTDVQGQVILKIIQDKLNIK